MKQVQTSCSKQLSLDALDQFGKNERCSRSGIFMAQKTSLGYGLELTDSLDRYMGGEPDSDERKAILCDYQSWMKNCRQAEHICSADITFFTENQRGVKEALTILITPARGRDKADNHRTYVTALRKYIKGGHTMAPHAVFASGIPSYLDETPETSEELKDFYNKYPTVTRDLQNGMLLTELAGEPESNVQESCVVEFFADDMNTYGKDGISEKGAVEVSQKKLSEQWEAWLRALEAERDLGNLKSCSGRAPRWAVGLPVGYRDSSAAGSYQLVACVFLVLDSGVSREDIDLVHEATRYVMLHLYEANATRLASRKGELEGVYRLRGASHEVKYVIDAIDPRLPDFAVNWIRDYFRHLYSLVSPSVSETFRRFNLAGTIDAKLKQAAEIHQIVDICKRGMIGNQSNEKTFEDISEFIERVNMCRSDAFAASQTCECRADHLQYFELALLAVFRNLLKHTFFVSNRDQRISMGLVVSAGGFCLDVRNSFTVDFPSQDTEGASTGTITAVRAYVSSYNRNAKLARLRRVGVPQQLDDGFRVEWQTLLPLPDIGTLP